jgi:hypothetical protein
MRQHHLIGLLAAGILAWTAGAQAAVIQQITEGQDVETIYLGQSIRTQPGLSWNNLAFAWLGPNLGQVANGGLFILTQEYLGTPGGLGAATPGFVARSTGIVNGSFQFAPTVQLLPNTLYYFYTNAVTTSAGHAANADSATFIRAILDRHPLTFPNPSQCSDGALGCQAYIALPDPLTGFYAFPGANANFVLSGTPVPEPSFGWLVLAVCALAAIRPRAAPPREATVSRKLAVRSTDL